MRKFTPFDEDGDGDGVSSDGAWYACVRPFRTKANVCMWHAQTRFKPVDLDAFSVRALSFQHAFHGAWVERVRLNAAARWRMMQSWLTKYVLNINTHLNDSNKSIRLHSRAFPSSCIIVAVLHSANGEACHIDSTTDIHPIFIVRVNDVQIEWACGHVLGGKKRCIVYIERIFKRAKELRESDCCGKWIVWYNFDSIETIGFVPKPNSMVKIGIVLIFYLWNIGYEFYQNKFNYHLVKWRAMRYCLVH